MNDALVTKSNWNWTLEVVDRFRIIIIVISCEALILRTMAPGQANERDTFKPGLFPVQI